MRIRLLSTALSAALVAIAPAQAVAANSATATLSITSVQFLDATTLGALASGITWNEASIAQSFVAASVFHDAAPALDVTATGFGSLPFGAVSRQATSPHAQSQASVSGGNGTNPLTGTVLDASGSSTASASAGFSARAIAPDGFFTNGAQFTLAPKTIAIFRATVSLTANADLAPGADSYMEASGSLRVFGSGPSDISGTELPCGCGDGAQDVLDRLSVTASSGQSFSKNDTLTVLFVNTTNLNKMGFLSAEVNVFGLTAIAPIPEPGHTAMLVAGLGVIGVSLRRRRR